MACRVGARDPAPRGAAPVPQRRGAGRRRAVLGRRSASTARCSPGSARSPATGRSTASASTRGRSTTACSTATARCSATPLSYRDRAHRRRARRRCARPSPPPSCTPSPGCSSCRSTPSTSSWPRTGPPRSRRPRRCCCCRTCSAYWLTGEVGAERTNASTTGLYDVAAARVGARPGQAARPALVDPAAAARPRDRGRPAAARGRRVRRRARTYPVIAVGSHDTASAVVGVPAGEDALRLHLLRHLVAGRARARRAGADRGGAGGRLHQRGRRRRHHPVPQERDGAVGALGVVRTWADRRLRTRPAGPAGRAAEARRRCARSSTSTTRGSCARHARRRMPARIQALAARGRRADPAHPVGDHPLRSWTASRSPTAATSALGRRRSPAAASTSCTSSAAARRTPCSAS